MMTHQLEAQAQEFESCKNVCDMYLAKEAGYKSEIVDLSAKVAELEKRLKNETSKLREQLKQLRISSKNKLDDVN